MEYFSREECKKILLEKCSFIYRDSAYIATTDNNGKILKSKVNQHLLNSIIFHTLQLSDSCKLAERMYWILNDIYEKPKCKQCDKFVSFRSFNIGYSLFCSSKCSSNDKDWWKSRTEKSIEKHGVPYFTQTQIFKEKSKAKKKEKYDDETFTNPEKSKRTKKEKYGDENYGGFGSIEFNNRLIEKYGDKNYRNVPKWKKSYYDKSDEERKLISKKRIETKKKKYIDSDGRFHLNTTYYSKISQILFWRIYDKLPEQLKDKTYFGELNKEFAYYNWDIGEGYFYDFVISSIKICIEYDGEWFHSKSDVIAKDERKQKFLEDRGFKVIRIPQKDFERSRPEVINYCLEEINKLLKEKPLL
jgi:hypothetical protein